LSLADLLDKALAEPARGLHLHHVYYQDLGTALDDTHDIAVLETALVEYNEWCNEHAKGQFRVALEPHNLLGSTGTVADVRYWLVISFDLSGDAMLSRMTWPDLRKYPARDKRRGRTRKTS
jgi:hypothetical protein